MLRRDFVKLSTAALAAGCAGKTPAPKLPATGQLLVDAHCHVFNASDLPAARFLRQVIFQDYPKQSLRMLGIRDPDVADLTFQLALRILGARKAPNADREIAYLTRRVRANSVFLDRGAARDSALDDTAKFFLQVDRRERAKTIANVRASDQGESPEAKFLRFYVGEKAVQKTFAADQGLSRSQARAAAERTFNDLGIISRHLNWLSLFRLYRHALVDHLVGDLSRQGFAPVMLAPALLDFDEWLFEDVRTPLPRQIEVMDHVARRPGPAIHGYVGFDPLREVAYKAGTKGATSSLATVTKALNVHGFAGVKLYPPMGFRASGNTGPYPERTLKRLGFEPDRQLDAALDELYALCARIDAPILAHGYASNAAGPDYEDRADPVFWLPVFKKHRKLRVCLGHFGRFSAYSEGKSRQIPDGTWEWTLGEFIKANPRQPIFADISYFSEALADAKTRQPLANHLKRWIAEFDPKGEHLLFGTDWIMVGREKGVDHYAGSVNTFLRHDCGFDDDLCDRIFHRNALRFLPLQPGSVGRQRLLDWYDRTGVDPQRLPLAPTDWTAWLASRWGRKPEPSASGRQ